MIIDQIAICDFRSYAGLHEIPLTPRIRYGAERPVVLFGGLNGTGKTTILLAVKLALYGRQGLGLGTSKSEYEKFIGSCIHTPQAALVKPNSAYVALDFTYGKLGKKTSYRIRRDWYLSGSKFEETLRLYEDGIELKSLRGDECQGFLNELIPVGVSELFFFDGEKIAELAEDDTGGALGDAIRRLLGLDLVDRLRTDLRVYALKYGKEGSTEAVREEIENLEADLGAYKKEIEERGQRLRETQDELSRKEAERDRAEIRLTELGGEWGQSREGRKARARELSISHKRLQIELRTAVAGVFPLALASPVLQSSLEDTASILEALQVETTNDALKIFANAVSKEADVDAASINRILSRHLRPTVQTQPLIDVSLRELAELEHTMSIAAPSAKKRISEISASLSKVSTELDDITLQINRAPDEETLKAELDTYTTLSDEVATITSEFNLQQRELKLVYQQAIECARALRKANERSMDQKELEAPLAYAAKARSLLKEFGQINAERKVKQLELEFTEAFRRLARKEDIAITAKIDPIKFTVSLIDSDGRSINKSLLSAGEKQIYAIAMLEALARTSGRRLPVIIDTPLGRLDSKHRANLVEHYFPRASHQVVLLSTDTEVDEPFYRALSPQTSHAFEIVFDEQEKSSFLREGYFWRQSLREAV